MKEIKEAIEKDKELQKAISFARTLDIGKIKSFFPLPKSWESKKVNSFQQYLQSVSNEHFDVLFCRSTYTDEILIRSKKYPNDVFYTMLSYSKTEKTFVHFTRFKHCDEDKISYCEKTIEQIFTELENLKQLINKLPYFTKQAVIKEIVYQLKVS